MFYISLGPNCHIAGALNDMNLRCFSLPFDFLLNNMGLKYIANLVDNNFADFLNNLTYNKINNKEIVISENYPNVLFFHHDLIKNKQNLVKSLKIDHKNMDELLIEKFKRRGHRFMNIISDSSQKCMFFYILEEIYITNKILLISLIDQISFLKNIMYNKFKCTYKLIIFIIVNNNEELLEEIICDLNKNYKNIVFEPFFGGNNKHDNEQNISRCINKYSKYF
tara:strand:- start:148 stop:816 length:669 start_codon:yes stop_codon:yes gene_type:complete